MRWWFSQHTISVIDIHSREVSAMQWFSRLFRSASTNNSRSLDSNCSRPCLEALEDRCVPSAATVDLTTAGSNGSIGGAIFQEGSTQPAGSGVIHSFVRIHALGGAPAEQGYNTGARP